MVIYDICFTKHFKNPPILSLSTGFIVFPDSMPAAAKVMRRTMERCIDVCNEYHPRVALPVMCSISSLRMRMFLNALYI